MAKRNVLHISKLENLKKWLVKDGWQLLPLSNNHYEVLRAGKAGRQNPLVIYSAKSSEHLSFADRDMPVIGAFLRDQKKPQTNADRIRSMTDEQLAEWLEELKQYRAIGTPEECQTAMEKQNVNKELESHDEKHTLECCISLMQEMVNEFAEWYRWQHGEDAIEELDEEERFCFRKSYFSIVQELFLIGTNHSGGTSTRAKCEQLGVDSAEEIEFDWSDEE